MLSHLLPPPAMRSSGEGESPELPEHIYLIQAPSGSCIPPSEMGWKALRRFCCLKGRLS